MVILGVSDVLGPAVIGEATVRLVHETWLFHGKGGRLLHVLLFKVGVLLLSREILAKLRPAHGGNPHVDIGVELIRLQAVDRLCVALRGKHSVTSVDIGLAVLVLYFV